MSEAIARLNRCFLEAMLIRRRGSAQIVRLRVARRRAGYALLRWRAARSAQRVRRFLGRA